ncbi:MAG: hypothetical protein Q8908_16485, partial [Bacteroidota bacterium]|nr:hypothetical protein [Bacteroidota bacterium]
SKFKNVSSDTTCLSGIAIESVDGAHIERININNISMTDVLTPLFMRLGSRAGSPGEFKDIIISSINAKSHSMLTSSITGIPGARIQGIVLRDLIFENLGEGTLKDAATPVPEKEKAYPENTMFGSTLPAHGLYIRHADNLTMENVQLRTSNPDERPAFIMDDVTNVSLQNFQAEAPSSTEALIKLMNCKNILISGYRHVTPLKKFLRVEGEASQQIRVLRNDLSGIKVVADVDKKVSKNEVLVKDNY